MWNECLACRRLLLSLHEIDLSFVFELMARILTISKDSLRWLESCCPSQKRAWKSEFKETENTDDVSVTAIVVRLDRSRLFGTKGIGFILRIRYRIEEHNRGSATIVEPLIRDFTGSRENRRPL